MSLPEFHQRFDLEVGAEEAKRRFVNRVLNYIGESVSDRPSSKAQHLMKEIAYTLGERRFYILSPHEVLDRYLQGDFLRSLQALEGLHKGLQYPMFEKSERQELSVFVTL